MSSAHSQALDLLLPSLIEKNLLSVLFIAAAGVAPEDAATGSGSALIVAYDSTALS